METMQWLSQSQMEMEEKSFFLQWQDSLDPYTEKQIEMSFGQAFGPSSLSSESQSSSFSNSAVPPEPAAAGERPKKVMKSDSWDSGVTEQSSAAMAPDASSPTILYFGGGRPAPSLAPKSVASPYAYPDLKPKKAAVAEVQDSHGHHKRSYGTIIGEGLRKGSFAGAVAAAEHAAVGRSAVQNQEHIMAERKRREKLSQKFIALSKIVPGLKKMDKASVLGDAIKYLKQMEDKVKVLESQETKRTVESAVLVKKSQLSDDGSSSCADENFDRLLHENALLEIEAKMSETTVMIKIHCENRKGILVKILSEIENMNMTIESTNVIPFASSSLDVTATAHVDKEFAMTVQDIVKKLNTVFRNLN